MTLIAGCSVVDTLVTNSYIVCSLNKNVQLHDWHAQMFGHSVPFLIPLIIAAMPSH